MCESHFPEAKVKITSVFRIPESLAYSNGQAYRFQDALRGFRPPGVDGSDKRLTSNAKNSGAGHRDQKNQLFGLFRLNPECRCNFD